MSGLRWSVEQRLAFAARRLYWDGTLNREDIMQRFGVSANQASADLAQLKRLYPGEFAYDASEKRYVAGAGFAPREADPTALLTELRLIAEGQMPANESLLAPPPPLAIADAPTRRVPAPILRAVLVAIRDQTALRGRYRSFQREEVAERMLSPHALVFDGFRWHARAFDSGDESYKDFVLARLSELSPAGAARAGAEGDRPWNTFVDLVIAPHPGLTPHQQEVIALDYGMSSDRRLTLTVREAVQFYVKRRLGLVEGHQQRPPHEQQIVLVREAVR